MSYIRVSLRGTISSGEVWSVNPAFNETTNVTGFDQLAGQNAAEAIASRAIPAILKTTASADIQSSSVRIERRTDDGALLGAAEAGWLGAFSGSGAATKPPQTSVVLSLRSAIPGARGRGRLYWPALNATMGSPSLRLSGPTITSLAEAAVEYLDGIETDLKNELAPPPSLLDYRLCIVSPTSGTRTDVTSIRVGDVLDVQRRRRDKMTETYASAPYPG